MSQIHVVLFNLSDPNDNKMYETILNRELNGEIFIKDEQKTWGNKAEGVLFVCVTYQDREDY